ncbi:rhomboid family intramembrane serine protease [Budvicia diplopodorum]|uniref:rhomboid family intramembrane serine protease n=1 Tax=Budvicia diplopodorum TaxID=1119056 RepID=UPI00135C61BB|nr:rhomboid family intramembrane serine protease [Budvicia diplopodorum]
MKQWIKQRVWVLSILAIVLMAIACANSLTGNALNSFGILPRTSRGLIGILCAPWLHSDWEHVFSNLPILLILSALLITGSVRYYIVSSVYIILLSGFLVWLFARSAIHIGASGWIFGLWALLLARAFTQRRILDFIFAILVFIYYGTIASGMLPGVPSISFEAHIAGAISGLSYALLTRRRNPMIKRLD